MPTAVALPNRADTTSDKIKPDASTNFDNRGSFDYDLENGYTLKWDNLVKFQEWLEHETESKTIELVRKEIRPNPNRSTTNHWIEKHIYVCGRGFSGGKKNYKRKHAWTRKVPIKRTGCTCRLTVKTYPGRDTILGNYHDVHSHEIGNKNARFTRLPKSARKEIERLLRLSVDPKKVVSSPALSTLQCIHVHDTSSKKSKVEFMLKTTHKIFGLVKHDVLSLQHVQMFVELKR